VTIEDRGPAGDGTVGLAKRTAVLDRGKSQVLGAKTAMPG